MRPNRFYRYSKCPKGPIFKCLLVDDEGAILLNVTTRPGKTYELPPSTLKRWQEMKQVITYTPKDR